MVGWYSMLLLDNGFVFYMVYVLLWGYIIESVQATREYKT